ncbi:MAG: valine--tRNA ligase [Rhabdochlamydiaceae bacterium]|nr:valine--tRNA ligase [Candidatus Amphrikana amoebophyrae]
MSDLPKSYEHDETEEKWNLFWEQQGFFKADHNSDKDPYCIILPPPNVTGVLHMGHALDTTLQDILSRRKRMQGFEVLWLPGFDHAGISTQTVVEKHLIKTEGKCRKDYDRDTFLDHVWAWKESHENKIMNQLKKVGCSLDWSRKRFTMDEKACGSVRSAFKMLYDEGLIYQGDYLVNWDPITQTALADDEVEYEEKASFMWHFRYPVKDEDTFIEIATTRPETMLGDTAIAVNPKDDRYIHLIGKSVILPLTDREIPIIADDYVDREFGTGCVKITPAHDFNDYEVGLRHNLPMVNIMTPEGLINHMGGCYEGLSMQEARAEIVKKMQEMNLLTKTEPHIHRVGHSYRSKAVIEPYLSKQWFVKMSHFKAELLDLVKTKKIELLPEHYQKTYFHWIENLRDWCISRQLWWGHRIPIWYHKEDKERIICHDGDDLPEEVAKDPSMWEQDEDVLDTWFSSALWPFSTLGWPDEKSADLNKFFPTSILITGHDILFFWVARMILMSHITMKSIPFQKTFIHGLIYGKSYWTKDKTGTIHYVPKSERISYELGKTPPSEVESKWEKMSKSKGNVIDPIEIIESYGADAMRMALCASVTDSRQIDLDRRRFEEYKNFSNKLWNATRFILMNLESLTPNQLGKGLCHNDLTLDDSWILSKLNQIVVKVNDCLDNYDFDDAAILSYQFFWDQFCAYYLETSKPYFSEEKSSSIKQNKQVILLTVLTTMIRLIHPITPFITEELFFRLKERFSDLPKSSSDIYAQSIIDTLCCEAIAVAPYPSLISKKDIDSVVECNIEILNQVVYQIRNIRGEMQIPPQDKVDVYFIGSDRCETMDLIKENHIFIKALVKVDKLNHLDIEPSIEHSATGMVKNIKIVIPLPEKLLDQEKKRLKKESEKLKDQIETLIKKLENKQFIERAPKELVLKTQSNLKAMTLKLKEIEFKL